MSLVALGAMCVLSKVNSYGKAFTAGFNVGNKLDTLAFLPTQSMAAAVISFVGQNMGAGREDRVRQGVTDLRDHGRCVDGVSVPPLWCGCPSLCPGSSPRTRRSSPPAPGICNA